MASTTDAAVVPPARRVAGRTRVPGDKSISHRYAMFGALADGLSTISGYSPGADCATTLAMLRALGAGVRQTGDHAFEIQGRGLRGLQPANGPLDAGNSGTTIRLMAGILAAHRMETTIGGDRSLSKRPMTRVIDPLTRMGARIEAPDGRPPRPSPAPTCSRSTTRLRRRAPRSRAPSSWPGSRPRAGQR